MCSFSPCHRAPKGVKFGSTVPHSCSVSVSPCNYPWGARCVSSAQPAVTHAHQHKHQQVWRANLRVTKDSHHLPPAGRQPLLHPAWTDPSSAAAPPPCFFFFFLLVCRAAQDLQRIPVCGSSCDWSPAVETLSHWWMQQQLLLNASFHVKQVKEGFVSDVRIFIYL